MTGGQQRNYEHQDEKEENYRTFGGLEFNKKVFTKGSMGRIGKRIELGSNPTRFFFVCRQSSFVLTSRKAY